MFVITNFRNVAIGKFIFTKPSDWLRVPYQLFIYDLESVSKSSAEKSNAANARQLYLVRTYEGESA